MKKIPLDASIAALVLILLVLGFWQRERLPDFSHLFGRATSPLESHLPKADSATGPIRVRVVQPRRRTDAQVIVTQPAEVAPYYQVQLFAETSGSVVKIELDIGDEVSRGETIAEIRPAGSQTTLAILSPLDGVIIARSIDPGGFIPDAGLVPGAAPIISIAKTDILTISMNVPDQFAPYVKPGMTAWVRNPNAIDKTWIETKLSRVNPVVRTSDRTRQVQVDLFNGTSADYEELIKEGQINDFEDFKSHQPPEFPTNLAGSQKADLIPGLIYELRLLIDSISELPLVPSQAIVFKSGKPCVYVVEQERIAEVPVAVQFDDGQRAYVRRIDTSSGIPNQIEWTGNELIVLPQGLDLRPGKQVVTELQDSSGV